MNSVGYNKINKIESGEIKRIESDQDVYKKVEEKENIENPIRRFAIQKILEIENERKEFNQKCASADKIAISYNFSEQEIKKIKSEINFEEEIDKIKTEENKLALETFQTVSKILDENLPFSRRDLLRLSSKAFLLGSFFPSNFLKKLFKKKESEKTYELKSHFYEQEASKIQKELINDKYERVFSYFAKKGKAILPDEKFIEYKTSQNTIRALIPLELIKDEVINGSYEQVKLIHTHPTEGYLAAGILNSSIVEKIRNNEIKPPPMPPSFTDISNAMLRVDFFGKKIKIENEVIDPTGIWNYSIIDSENNFIKKISDFKKAIEDPNVFLSEDEIKILKKAVKEHPDLLFSMNPLVPPEIMKPTISPELAEQYIEIYKILIKLSGIAEEKMKNIGNENLLFIDETERLGIEIAKNTSESKEMLEKRKKDIDTFIKSWAKKGVGISYNSF